MIPRRIRIQILRHLFVTQLIKIRIIAYIYSVLYLYIGYYDFIKEIS